MHEIDGAILRFWASQLEAGVNLTYKRLELCGTLWNIVEDDIKCRDSDSLSEQLRNKGW